MEQDKFSAKKQKKFADMTKGKEVLELGGGRGEFVSLCKPIAKSIISIDLEPKGEGIIKEDVLKFLKKNKKKFDIIYARHIIEHFMPEDVILIFEYCFKYLNTEGILILVFPNLRNINVSAYEFWNDLSHKRPYTSSALIEQLEKIGFKIVNKEADNDSWDNSLLKKVVRWVRSMITGIAFEAPDYYIIAKKMRKLENKETKME